MQDRFLPNEELNWDFSWVEIDTHGYSTTFESCHSERSEEPREPPPKHSNEGDFSRSWRFAFFGCSSTRWQPPRTLQFHEGLICLAGFFASKTPLRMTKSERRSVSRSANERNLSCTPREFTQIFWLGICVRLTVEWEAFTIRETF